MPDYYATNENLGHVTPQQREDLEREYLVQRIVDELTRDELADVVPITASRCRCGRFRDCEPCEMFNGLGVTEWDRALREIDGA